MTKDCLYRLFMADRFIVPICKYHLVVTNRCLGYDSNLRLAAVASWHGRVHRTKGGFDAFASLFEWGGRNLDGSWGFDRYRPGWERPIQQLFVDHGVTIWFHGHDHLYAREVVDGVVYQAVPQPSTARYQGPDLAAQYGYDATPGETAFVLPSYLRVRVGEAVTVDLVRTVLPGDQTRTLVNGDVVTSYTVR